MNTWFSSKNVSFLSSSKQLERVVLPCFQIIGLLSNLYDHTSQTNALPINDFNEIMVIQTKSIKWMKGITYTTTLPTFPI